MADLATGSEGTHPPKFGFFFFFGSIKKSEKLKKIKIKNKLASIVLFA